MITDGSRRDRGPDTDARALERARCFRCAINTAENRLLKRNLRARMELFDAGALGQIGSGRHHRASLRWIADIYGTAEWVYVRHGPEAQKNMS